MDVELVSLDRQKAIMRIRCDETSLRPGGSVAGPIMMGLADAAFYAVILANLGMVPLAVTTSFNINFLRKPGLGDLYCRASILKLGSRLAVCDAIIYTNDPGEDEPAAHATGTYSIPPS